MSKAATQSKVVPLRPVEARQPTRLELSRALARALAKKDRAEALLREATREIDAVFGPWAAGRVIDRDTAREQLTSAGFLPERKLHP